MALTQDLRQAKIVTELGDDVVVLERLSCHERLSELFTVIADVVSQDRPIDFSPLLGTQMSVSMQDAEFEGISRDFSGILFESELTDATDLGVHYRLTLRPWFALLAGNRNIKIFQNVSVVDILSQIVAAAGFDEDYEYEGTGTYPVREFCVQYRESDFAFLSRLMEEEGLYYYFEHAEGGRHILHVCDDASQHPLVSGLSETPYIAPAADDRAGVQPHLWRWDERIQPGAGKVSLRDFSFLQPIKTFDATNAESGTGAPGEKSELYDYPGGYGAYAVGAMDAQKDRYAKNRLAASRAQRQVYTGQGDAFALACGYRFTLTQYPDERLNADYLIIGATHAIDGESYRSGQSGQALRLEMTVEAIPAATQWRTPLRTPKPLVGGPQTATVVGPDGEAIYVDEYGRVKLQFRWDRIGKSDDQSSCWVRASQAWADTGFGTMLIPRIGEEVIVDFLEGDPDQPIITGRVYNPLRSVPYPLPSNKTRSTWKSRTVGDSGPYPDTEDPPPDENGFNEIRYEDKGGVEEVFVHAQRDLNAWIRHDESRKVGHDAIIRVGHSRQTNIKVDESLTVETGNETHTVQQGSRTTTINQTDALEVQQGDATRTVDMGNYTLTVSEGSATITAEQEILLKVGDNTIKLSPQGLEIQALTVSITAETSLSAQGLTSELKADTLVTINGMPVQIN
jgi:type VI secretion system secreted protein VgrG